MEARKKWALGVAAVIGMLVVVAGCTAIAMLAALGSGLGRNRIALIHLTGGIAARMDSTIPAADPEKLIAQLKRAEDDPSVRAILIRVNSGGGVASASQEIAMQVARIKKPVVVSIADIGASGAYMVAAEADKIVAAPSSDVGSIGVIMRVPHIDALAKKLGLGVTIIKQGKYKDMGNPLRKLTPEEIRMLQADIEISYEQFVEGVAKARELPVAKVRKLATGRTWTGTEAKELGLVDEIGNFQDAIDLAARLAKIKGRPSIVEYEAPSLVTLFSELANTAADAAAARAVGVDQLTDRRPVRQ